MNNLFFLRLAALVLPIFILISCSEKKPNLIAFSDEHVVITDSITIHLEEKMYSRSKSHRFFDDGTNLFLTTYFENQHSVNFYCVTDNSLSFSIKLPNSSKGSVGVKFWDYLVISNDSILFIPDNGDLGNPIFLFNEGHVIKTLSFSPFHFSLNNPFFFVSRSYHRMQFNYPFIINPISFHPKNLNHDNQIIGDYKEYTSRPHFSIINIISENISSFYYPLFFNNSLERAPDIISNLSINDLFLNWDFTPYISKYELSKESGIFDSIKTIDIRDFVPFEDKNHLATSGQAERLTVCDKIENMIFDENRKRFYVILTKGIHFEDSDDVFVSSFLEKPTYILVFDEELNYLHNKKFPSPKYAEGKHTIALTKDHMLLPISDDPFKQFNQLYLIRIDLDELNK
jgi:hypothetical protein